MAGNVPRKRHRPARWSSTAGAASGLTPLLTPIGSVYVKSDDAEYGVGYWDTSSWNQGLEQDSPEFRSLPALVEVVELLCDEASGSYSRLRVVDVPDDAEVYISEYDGRETVREVHRSWG